MLLFVFFSYSSAIRCSLVFSVLPELLNFLKMATSDEIPSYVLEFSCHPTQIEDIGLLLTWILDSFAKTGLQLSCSPPVLGKVSCLS